MSSSPNNVLVQFDDINQEDIHRAKSTESMDNFDISEENILSALFQGIPTQHVLSKKNENNATIQTDTNNIKKLTKLKCVNVPRSKSITSKSWMFLKTGFREPDEIRIICKKRPLGIQIKPHNIHGFGAKISKITNINVYNEGVRENMIITGLNNKDLLGCTFDQIMNILKCANLPITLRLKPMNLLPINNCNDNNNNNSTHSRQLQLQYGPQRHKNAIVHNNIIPLYDMQETQTNILMLQSFSVDNMPISTVLSSSSDEELEEYHYEKEEEEEEEELEQEDDDEMCYVNWNNIRLGASVIKHGWGLDINNDPDEDDDDTTFELAYHTLTKQGLNIYEIRAAIRLIRQQPEQIPPLETFNTLSINHKRMINSSINPKFMPQQWLKEKNLNNNNNSSESESESLSSGPRTSSLENELKRMTLKQENTNSDIDSDSDSDSHSDSDENNNEYEYEYKPKQAIKGYIDFFDDNETSSEEESQSITKSIKVEQMFDLIGLKSPPIENMLNNDNDNDNDNDNNENTENDANVNGVHRVNRIGLVQSANGELVIMDKKGNIVATPNGVNGFDENIDFYHQSSSDGEYSQYEYEYEYDHEYEHELDGIGVSSYICTDGADMIDNDCIPQVMLKYSAEGTLSDTGNNYNNNQSNNRLSKVKNIMHHLRNNNNKLVGLKNSFRGLTIKTNVKSIFKKMSPSPNHTPDTDTSHNIKQNQLQFNDDKTD